MRITDAGAGPRLTYIRVFEERMPAAPNYFEYDTVQDEFDGRLIDDLPEARYLGRLVQDRSTANASRRRGRCCRLVERANSQSVGRVEIAVREQPSDTVRSCPLTRPLPLKAPRRTKSFLA